MKELRFDGDVLDQRADVFKYTRFGWIIGVVPGREQQVAARLLIATRSSFIVGIEAMTQLVFSNRRDRGVLVTDAGIPPSVVEYRDGDIDAGPLILEMHRIDGPDKSPM
ncbi:hypothetical protein [Massilia genomosp. 1]|uniref:hypothetical protein n=1 Tax=Massilia genomosp. 1 TaxID=2609280 RepID=UPI0014205868|nr:hypothetical protein [Massilia genomosp. 1]